jgi:hypothetical protein
VAHLILHTLSILPILVLDSDLVSPHNLPRRSLPIQNRLVAPIIWLAAVMGVAAHHTPAIPPAGDHDRVVLAPSLGALGARAILPRPIGNIVLSGRGLDFADEDSKDGDRSCNNSYAGLGVAPNEEIDAVICERLASL